MARRLDGSCFGFQYDYDFFHVGFESDAGYKATELLLCITFFYPVELDVIFGVDVAFRNLFRWHLKRSLSAELVFGSSLGTLANGNRYFNFHRIIIAFCGVFDNE